MLMVWHNYVQNKNRLNKQIKMRSSNKLVNIQPNYSQSRSQYQPYMSQLYQPPFLCQSRMTSQRQQQKTEQPRKTSISTHAINSINQQLYEIVYMDPRSAEASLRKSQKTVFDLVDKQLFMGIKHLSNMKLFMYNTILMYVDECSQHEKDKRQASNRQRSVSKSSSKKVLSQKQQEVALKNYSPFSNLKQLQNLKQTIPFVPKDKSRIQKSSRVQMLQEELTHKIESTKQSLQNILKKIQHYNNYRLSEEDIFRLKKSVINVSQLRPSQLLNLHTSDPTQSNTKASQLENSRTQSRSNKQDTTSSASRTQSRSKTYNNLALKQSINTSSMNSRVSDIDQDQQGNKLLIVQLEQIIEKKENRIKQLTRELSKNLSDQKQLEGTIEGFEVEIHEIQCQRKNFHLIIQKLQQENLNYQLEIKELKDSEILRRETDKLSPSQHQDSSHYHVLKEFEKRQKALKFIIQKQLEITVESTLNMEGSSTDKNIHSLSGAMAFHDISQITPKRLSKKLMLPAEIEQSYLLQNNVITTRKNITPEDQSRQKRRDRSLSKYQMVGGNKTQSKNKREMDSYYGREELKDNERENYQKMLFLQALTIQQVLQDM